MRKIKLAATLVAVSMLLSCFVIGVPAANSGLLVGDANSDEIVDSRDLLQLRKYLACLDYDTGKSTIEIGEGADLDGNGNVDLSDLYLLRQFLANDEEELVIYDAKGMENVLKSSVIFKPDSSYAFVCGRRVSMEHAPIIFEGKVLYPVDFITDNQIGTLRNATITEIGGVKYTTSDAFTCMGKQIYVFEESGYILITEKNWRYSGQDSQAFYSELERKVNNLYAIGTILSAKMTGDRPVIFETDEMLAESKSNATLRKQPWLTSWQNVLKKANQSLEVAPSPYLGKSGTQYRRAACNDFINARSLALAYYHTGETKYINRAIEYLMAYAGSDVLPGTDDHLDYSAATTDGKADLGLNIAIPLTTACDVYSLLYPYMNESDKAVFENWVHAEVEMVKKGHDFWIENNYYSGQIGNNHLSSHVMGLMCAAYVLEDDELLEYAVIDMQNDSSYVVMLERAILMEGDETCSSDLSDEFVVGEIYDRYRIVSEPSNGFGYAMYHLKFLTYSAFIAYNNGLDLFSYVGSRGENLLLPYQVYAEYLIENDGVISEGYYANNSLDEENSYTLYLIANYVYGDERVAQVIEALDGRGVVPGDNEQFGRSGGYIFGK